MMPVANVRTPRRRVGRRRARGPGDRGPEAIRVEVLADTLGVTKGGFYWHYAGRPAFLAEMLDAWEKTVVDDVITIVEGKPDGPQEKLQRLFGLAASVDLDVELAVREWARRDDDVAARCTASTTAARTTCARCSSSSALTRTTSRPRCLLAFSIFIGSHFVATDHRGRTRAEVLHLAFDRLLIGADD